MTADIGTQVYADHASGCNLAKTADSWRLNNSLLLVFLELTKIQ